MHLSTLEYLDVQSRDFELLTVVARSAQPLNTLTALGLISYVPPLQHRSSRTAAGLRGVLIPRSIYYVFRSFLQGVHILLVILDITVVRVLICEERRVRMSYWTVGL